MVLLHDVGITSLCVSLSIFYLRLLNIFSASSLIGPKLVVIGRMVCTRVLRVVRTIPMMCEELRAIACTRASS